MSLKISKSKLLVVGYIGYIERRYKMSVASNIHCIVLIFYPKTYKLYGIGATSYHQFGLKEEYEEGLSEKKWHYLSKMSALCHDPTLISCSYGNVCIYNIVSNEIYGIGRNQYGSLGVDSQLEIIDNFTRIKFEDIKDSNNYILDIMNKGSESNHRIIALKDVNNQNQIFYGFGQYNNNKNNNYFPTKIDSLNYLFKDITIIQIVTGYSHSLFLTLEGRVYSFGKNKNGECGIKIDAKNEYYSEPQMVPFLNDMTMINISCGQHHNLCVDKNNAVWCFGDNFWNQLGLGPQYDNKNEIETAIINPYFNADSDDNKIVFIECGEAFSLCINKKGKAYMFGCNEFKQCGECDDINDTISVPFCIQSMEICKNVLFESGSCSYGHTALLSYDPYDNVYIFGQNASHQCGNINGPDEQMIPYLNSNTDIGVDANAKIVKIICDCDSTIVISQI